MAQPATSHDPATRGYSGRRSREATRRVRRIEISLTSEEFAALDQAASRAALSRGAYTARAALAAARGGHGQDSALLREALAELIRSAGLARRAGVNLNQAVAKLNATGQPPGDLLPWAQETMRRAHRLDAAAEEVRKRLP
jgi:hypothetical protein